MEMEFSFEMPVKLLVGQGIIDRHQEEFGRWGKKCLIVTGASSAKKSGALDDVTRALESCGVEWELFDKVGQNPLVSVCYAGGKAAIAAGAEFIIGIGGGSPMDAAKAVSVYAANPELTDTGIYDGWEKTPLPLLLVGTTAGTGSEVTSTAVLTIDSTGQKRSVGNSSTFARVSFGDPQYTMSLPLGFSVSSGLDAVSHALESYFSTNSDPLSDIFALEAMKILLPALKEMWYSEKLDDPGLRDRLYTGSIYAGFALARCGMLFCHTMGYYLSEEAGIPHGYACAAFLPELIQYSVPLAPEKSRRLFATLGIYAAELCDTITMLNNSEFEPISDKKLEELLLRWNGLKNMKRTPGDFNTERQREVARRVLQKKIEGDRKR